jgi:hypothetical protein
LNEFLLQDALPNQIEGLSATRIVTYNDIVAGFFTLVNDSITVLAVQETDRNPSYPYSKYPAIKIARFATHEELENHGIGTKMISKIYGIIYNISKHTGCRMITVDSKDLQ